MRFFTNGDRIQHRKALQAVLEGILAGRTTDEWVDAPVAAGESTFDVKRPPPLLGEHTDEVLGSTPP